MCVTALLTGLRLSELLSLQWNDIDFTSKVILVRNTVTFTTKTRKNRIVPMSDELYRLLKERKEAIRFECEVVFHNKNGGELLYTSVSQKFKKYIRRAGLNDKLHFHSLRHSFATALVSAGVSLYAVQKLLGHTTIRTTEIYSHLLPQQLHFEVNKGLHSIEASLLNPINNEVKNGAE
jgi:integrase/recombinase XerD